MVSRTFQDLSGPQASVRYLDATKRKISKLDKQLTRHTRTLLTRLFKEEQRLKGPLSRLPSAAPEAYLNARMSSIQQMERSLASRDEEATRVFSKMEFIPYMDTLSGSLSYLSEYYKRLPGAGALQSAIEQNLQHLHELEGRWAKVRRIQDQAQRQLQELEGRFSSLGAPAQKYLDRMSRGFYYYRQKVRYYQDLWKHPDRVEQKTLSLLRQTPSFKKYMDQHSALVGLFPIGKGDGVSLKQIPTREQMKALVQSHLSGAGPGQMQLVQNQMRLAMSKLGELKSRYSGLKSTAQMPQGPVDPIKGKTFGQRLELGSNVAFARATHYYPTTGELAFQAGYKFNKKGSLGLGTSLRMGLGQGLQNIHFSVAGLGLRSYIDYKFKGTFYLSGGWEYTLTKLGSEVHFLNGRTGWTKSALLGLEKKYRISSKLKGTIYLLYDFLHNQHIPAGPPIVFRTGYCF